MGAGVDPHLYKPSAGDVRRMSEADAVFYNGLHLEAKMADVLESLGSQQPTAALAEAIPAAELLSPAAFEDAHDPHVWFDPDLWRHAVTAAATELTHVDPDHGDLYARNAAQPGALTAMIDYYRALVRGGGARRQAKLGYPVIEVPTLMIWGEEDTALGKELTVGTEDLVADLTLRMLPGVSHWVQQEDPETVNAMIVAWLEGRLVPDAGEVSRSATTPDSS